MTTEKTTTTLDVTDFECYYISDLQRASDAISRSIAYDIEKTQLEIDAAVVSSFVAEIVAAEQERKAIIARVRHLTTIA